jgi:hypothetical protein
MMMNTSSTTVLVAKKTSPARGRELGGLEVEAMGRAGYGPD